MSAACSDTRGRDASAPTPVRPRSSPHSQAASAPSTSATADPERARVLAAVAGARPTEWGLHVTGTVNRGSDRGTRAGLVALTFDACGGHGGSGYDEDLIRTLRRHQVPATLFLNARWIAENGARARELARDGLFEIASHGARHLPLSCTGQVAYRSTGFRSPAEVYDELVAGREAITRLTGRAPRWFRPGTAFCDEVAARMARLIDMPVVDFSVNGDAGTTFTAKQVARSVGRVRPGDIVISHMNHPEHATAEGYAKVLPSLLAKGVRFARLSDAMA